MKLRIITVLVGSVVTFGRALLAMSFRAGALG